MSSFLLFLAGLSLAASPQDQKTAPDAADICKAVRKGVGYLRSQEQACLEMKDIKSRKMCARELVLWTLLQAGVSPADPFVQTLFNEMSAGKLEATYPVALEAMILESLDRVRYQLRIAKCAQFLVDNQSEDGQWGYGDASPYVDDFGGGMKPLPPLDHPQDLKVRYKVKVKKNRDWDEGTDTSNTYFAALGLRAAGDAGVIFETPVLEAGLRFWKVSHVKKEGESGWGYDRKNKAATPAATASAVSALLIYGNLLGKDLTKDALILVGSESLAGTWNGGRLTTMPGGVESRLLNAYGLYAVEVAEVFLGKDHQIGRDWYREGAGVLLGLQKPNGSWDSGVDAARVPGGNGKGAPYFSHPIWDTCFSILFLSSGIRPLQEPTPERQKQRDRTEP